MPLHDYHCSTCGATHERLFSASETIPEETPCIACTGRMRKIISAPARKSDCGDNSYPYYEENICETPVLLESPSHRKAVLKQNGLAEGAFRKRGMPGQWI